MTMENSNNLFRSSPLIKSPSNPSQLHINRKFLYREFKGSQYLYDHVKRNLKGTANSNAVNSDHSNHINNENNVVETTNLVQYEHLSESWLELVLGSTILGISILGVVLIGVILFLWIRRYFRETSKVTKCSGGDKERNNKVKSICTYKKKMNSRKWLAKKQQEIESQVVSDLEQRLETIKFKNSPPNSPNSDKYTNEDNESEHQISECEGECDEI